jgi:Uri superfamily endonuclease
MTPGTLMSASTGGIYFLLIKLERASNIQAGKRGFHLESGCYGYVGSALSGLEKRVGRHLSATKKLHWHIDYLLNVAAITDVICGATEERKECALAAIISRRLPAVDGFGSSDCRCASHLFYGEDRDGLKKIVLNAFKELGLDPYRPVG